MPIELQLIRGSDFVCIEADEHLNFEEDGKVLQIWQAECAAPPCPRQSAGLGETP
jgi:hypothetical protein